MVLQRDGGDDDRAFEPDCRDFHRVVTGGLEERRGAGRNRPSLGRLFDRALGRVLGRLLDRVSGRALGRPREEEPALDLVELRGGGEVDRDRVGARRGDEARGARDGALERADGEYEPRSFPLEWDAAGNILEAFTPDFYLPEFDLYVELTTMKQSLVTRKNRKVRLLGQIYPEINIQVFYQKDFQNLLFKYNLVDRTVQI